MPNFKVKFLYKEKTEHKKIVIHSYKKNTSKISHTAAFLFRNDKHHNKPSKTKQSKITLYLKQYASEVANFASQTPIAKPISSSNYQ